MVTLARKTVEKSICLGPYLNVRFRMLGVPIWYRFGQPDQCKIVEKSRPRGGQIRILSGVVLPGFFGTNLRPTWRHLGCQDGTKEGPRAALGGPRRALDGPRSPPGPPQEPPRNAPNAQNRQDLRKWSCKARFSTVLAPFFEEFGLNFRSILAFSEWAIPTHGYSCFRALPACSGCLSKPCSLVYLV